MGPAAKYPLLEGLQDLLAREANLHSRYCKYCEQSSGTVFPRTLRTQQLLLLIVLGLLIPEI